MSRIANKPLDIPALSEYNAALVNSRRSSFGREASLDTFDDIDHQILALLQDDGRISNADIAAKVGLSPSSALARLRKLGETKVITGFAAVLDQEKVGLPTTAYVFITLRHHRRKLADSFLAKVQAIPAIMECYHITGKADYLLRVVSKDIPGYRALLMDSIVTMPEVESVETMFVLRTEKRDLRLPLGDRGVRSSVSEGQTEGG